MTTEAPRDSLQPDSGDILVVDDFPDSLALYAELLSEDGHRVRTARSGRIALTLVDEREPEVVLLDVSMPGMDGYEVLQRLRARRGGGPAVLMLTAARRDPNAIEHGLRQGADAYMTKPIESRELLARVRGALEAHRLRRMMESQRRDHIAMLVHDLRHPLASLGLVAEVLTADDLSPDERKSSVVTIRTLCADMARLVDGVLAASRLEAGVFQVDKRTTTARAILEPTIASLGPVAARRRIEIAFDGELDTHLSADPVKLRQAIDNLVANALKFTPRGGRVRVAVEARRGTVAFEVSDSGPGVPEAERATIFDRYRQGATGRTAGGAGLGLAIAKGIAEAHGGSIALGQGPFGGASFRLAVPA
ncbi:MAG TPA: hybrid sensor histidine kinase/response regulator [Polyangiaceae bacterium]|jgi:signal transduction histidine kinase